MDKMVSGGEKSEIPVLVRFAVQKGKRLPGLAAHAIYSISTGKLKASTTRSRSLKESATVTVMMTSSLP